MKTSMSHWEMHFNLKHVVEKLHVRSRTEAVMAYLHPGQDALPTAPRSAAAEDAPPRTRRK
jgi:hypothetical protein